MSSDERRLLLAFVLSLLVFLVYQYYMVRMYPPRPVPPEATDTSAVAEGQQAIPHNAGQPPPPSFAKASEGGPGGRRPQTASAEETSVLRANGLELTVTNFGAGIRQMRLAGIPRHPRSDERDVILADETWPYPHASLRLPGDSDLRTFKKVQETSRRISYVSDDGSMRVARTLELAGLNYEILISTKIENVSGRPLQVGPGAAPAIFLSPFPAKSGNSSDLDLREVFLKLGEDVEHRREETPGFFDKFSGGARKPAEEIAEDFPGQLRWLSLGDRYFTSTFVPGSALARASVRMKGPQISATAHYGSFELAAGGVVTFEDRLYAGPKLPAEIRRYGKDLLEIMNFGWFGWLGFWMLWLLNKFHRMIPNYGIAIILLTVVVRIVLYPLTYKSYVSMAKLKELAPKMKVVQEKYAENREKLNKEMMRLYKENRVNPAGGCLPILLQIPVFIAFYNMLQYAIELRGAPFWLWVRDLSEKDPYYVLPVLMGISMLIQQKMTPTPDPNQAKIGMAMTVVFTFLFLMFPSGLVLYWLVSNVLGIWQQKIIEKKLKPVITPLPQG